MKVNQEDNRTRPGIACCAPWSTAAHCQPCVSESKSTALQALASCPCLPAACQQHAGRHQQPSCTQPAQPNDAQLQRRREERLYVPEQSSRCWIWHSLASAELIQHVVLLHWAGIAEHESSCLYLLSDRNLTDFLPASQLPTFWRFWSCKGVRKSLED